MGNKHIIATGHHQRLLSNADYTDIDTNNYWAYRLTCPERGTEGSTQYQDKEGLKKHVERTKKIFSGVRNFLLYELLVQVSKFTDVYAVTEIDGA